MVSFDRIKQKRSFLFEQFGAGRLNGCRPSDVRNVLVVDSASRSGSSFLYYLLSRHPGVISLNGEGGVFERLHGIAPVRSPEDSDLVAPGAVDQAVIDAVAEDLLGDAGALLPEAGAPPESYALDAAQRLLLQYPGRDLDARRLFETCANALRRNGAFSAPSYWAGVVAELGLTGLARYDLGGPPQAALETEPETVLEEPPFVVPRPRALPAPAELRGKTLLLKSTSDCYRLWLVKRLFPRARLRFVLLARNPAASIAALADGWLSGGFHSRDLSGLARLDIAGYSDDGRPGSRRWWKFDLPPGWADFADKPLEQVCAFQWTAANERILADAASGLIEERFDLRYEALLGPASRAAELSRLWRFADLPFPPAGAAHAPAVMAVSAPAAGKWRRRREAIAPLMATPAVARMARALGYDASVWESWP